MKDHRLRAEELCGRMNLDEKIAQLHSIWLIWTNHGNPEVKTLGGLRHGRSSEDPYRLMAHGIGQITRPLGTAPIDAAEGVRQLNQVQEFLVKRTRMGIPAIAHEECLAGVMARGATLFPSGLNMGSLWDEQLVREIGAAIGTELESTGARQGLSPVLDVVRDARWGRTEECFGEDPYLVGSLGTAYVDGLQGPERRILATLKHFAGHSFGEGGRNHAPVHLGERELRDQFLLPFEMAVRLAKAGSVMPAYHDVDGEPFHQSRRFLTEVLRQEWGFEGIVVADYEGIAQLFTEHRTQESLEGAASAAMNAGVDVELPGMTAYGTALRKALETGRLEGATIDTAVRRILGVKSRIGLFEKPYADEGAVSLGVSGHRELSRQAAVRSTVMLHNTGVLPLKEELRVLLVGPLADDPLAMLNGYSFPVHLLSGDGEQEKNLPETLLAELTRRLEDRLVYRKGCDILVERPEDPPVFPGDLASDGSDQQTCISTDLSGIPAAAASAYGADVVVAFVGDLSGLFLTGTVGEGSDATSLRLPGPQEQLLDAMLDTGKPLVVIVSSGRPYNLGRAENESAAILQTWLPGGNGATALADILTGKEEPGGRLPVSIPRSAGAMPYWYNHKLKSAGTPIQPEFGALHPFGAGMGYTSFSFGNFTLLSRSVPTDGEIGLSCKLTNTGDRPGDEVIQIYIRDLYASLVRPTLELKAFRRLRLQPGESRNITFFIPCDMLSFTGRDGRRILEAGEVAVMAGTSSRDIAFRDIVTLEGPDRILDGEWRMRSRSTVE